MLDDHYIYFLQNFILQVRKIVLVTLTAHMFVSVARLSFR